MTFVIKKVSSQKLALFHKTESSGADHLHQWKGTVCSIFTLPTLTQDLFTHCSSSASCTDGGDMPLTVCIKPNMNSTTNCLKTCTTSSIPVCHQSPKSGSDPVDFSSNINKTSIINKFNSSQFAFKTIKSFPYSYEKFIICLLLIYFE